MKYFFFLLSFLLIFNCKEVKEHSKKDKIKKEIANDVFIPKEYEEKVFSFLNQIKNKSTYYPYYEVRITNKIEATSGDWRFFIENFNHIGEVKLTIKISKEDYQYLSSQIDFEISIDKIKDLYDCINNCFVKLNQPTGSQFSQCNCKK